MSTNVISPIQLLEKMTSDGQDIYEAAIALAMSAEGDMSARRWLLGDLALLVRKSYGKNRIAQFATAAGIARSTLGQYKNVSQHYPEETRYVYPNIGYATYRAAMRLKDDSLVFLAEASANGYTVEEAQIRIKERLGKPLPPLKLLDAEGCIESIDYSTGKLVLMLAPGADLALLEKYLRADVRVKIYEMEGE